jgi:RNA polymerase sigma factor (sigma-70 family)
MHFPRGNDSVPAAQSSEHLTQLLDRIRAGDEVALSQLLQQYEPRLRTAARVLLGPLLRPSMDSVDLVQSVHRVMLPVLREGKYDVSSPEQLLALAVTIVRRKVARRWRRVQKESVLQEEKSGYRQSTAENPVEVATAKDMLAHLHTMLTDEELQLVKLRLAGHTTIEIAKKLGYAAPALRARLSRLRQRLRSNGFSEWV